jgi:hypothetical protein
MIGGQITDNIYFDVYATNRCQSSEKRFKLEGLSKPHLNTMIFSYVHSFGYTGTMGMGANVSYFRTLANIGKLEVGFGGGLTVTNRAIGVNIGPLIKF